MSRRIFIMQRNATDTGWETKTVQGKGKFLGTDSLGSLTVNEYVTVTSSSTAGNRDIYYINEPAATIVIGSGHSATASLFLSGSNGPAMSFVRFRNTDGGPEVNIQAGSLPGAYGTATVQEDQHAGVILMRSAYGAEQPIDSPHIFFSPTVWSA
jgi:hypothetical protein